MDAISIASLFMFESIWFTTYYCVNIFRFMFKISQLTQQYIYVQFTYRNPLFCTYVSHKRHGQFFEAHSRISSLNGVGETVNFNSVGKIYHIFDRKIDIAFESYMTVLILLPCSIVLFLRL